MTSARRPRGAHAAPGSAAWLPAARRPKPRHARVVPGPLPAVLLAVAGGGLGLLAALPPSAVAEPARPVLAQAALPPVVVAPPPRDVPERASRTRSVPVAEPAPVQSAARPVPAPTKAAAPVLPGCDGRGSTSGHANGRLPGSVLCELPGASDERLRADAAVSFVRLAGAYEAVFGRPICVIDGYRTFAEQRTLRRTKPRLAAPAGTSEHGWGLAVDLGCNVQSSRSPQHQWLRANAERFGWFLPDWARPGGARPEPWHWEYNSR